MNRWSYLKTSLFFVFIMFYAVTVLFFTPKIYAAVSQKPPMGWNSYDCFNFTVTEAEVKANADYMAANLMQYGWQYICIDWAWYYTGTGTGSPGQDANFNPKLNIDSYGRVLPDTTRFPSSDNGQGFKPLADYIHSKGLKFGIHLMRGIPRQAVTANTPILGTSYRANDIADKVNLCAWLNLMYGLNMSHPAAQAYLNSLFQLYASWGVDFVKVDDLINPYGSPAYRQSEIEGYRTAINNCGREMVFSTSPGATPLANASHIMQYANQWRVANDLWDNWNNLNAMFDLTASWYPYADTGHWPDADMIPIGKLSKRGPNGAERWSNLTSDEKYTMMTLWCIARSPLIWGGNLVENRAEELQLMQNSEVIAVNQNSANNRSVVNGNTPLWCADVPGTNDKYVAIFNRNSSPTNITINFGSIGVSSSAMIRDLWAKSTVGTFSGSYTVNLGVHQSKLYRITPTSSPVVTPTPSPSGTIKVQFYNQSKTDLSNQLYLNFQLANTGNSAITLSNVKIRYWYTEDGTQAQSFWSDYSPVGSSNVTGTFVKMGTAKTGADTYLEIGFTSGAGSLNAGASIQVQCRCAKNDWSNYTQSNDYSFNSSASSYVDWTKVSGYVSGALVWGTEP
jgi:alpha-galactosidase